MSHPPAPTTSTTEPGSIITITGNQAPRSLVGPSNDASDFFGLSLAILAIVVAIVAARWLFGSRGAPGPLPEERRPGAPEAPSAAPPPEAPRPATAPHDRPPMIGPP